MKGLLLFLICIGLLCVSVFGQLTGQVTGQRTSRQIPFEGILVPYATYLPQTQIALEVDYAKHTIKNPAAWDSLKTRYAPTSIDLVFTKYPTDSGKWRTPYSLLLEDRVQAVYKLDPQFANEDITWRLVLQTK